MSWQTRYEAIPNNIPIGGMRMCVECRAYVVPNMLEAHDQFHARGGQKNMSNVKWCDPGNHAFKAGVPGSQSFNGSSVDDNGNIVQMSMDACPEHSFQPQGKTPSAVTDKPYGSPA